MGHLVEQVEVDAIETRVSKATTGQSDSPQQPGGQQQTQQHPPHTSPQQQHQQQAQAQQQQQHQQQQKGTGCLGHDRQSLARKANTQKEDESGSPDKKQREASEGDGEEDEAGWWAEKVVVVLGRMAGYRDTWYRSHAHLLHGDGPLPHTWRLYIAALAVCRHEVGWLMQALMADFQSAGGDPRWLVGLHHAPPKFSALASINNILAHQPWLLSPHHIQQLTKGEDSWSLGELCQALCIMTHFHALATFLHGSGLSTYTIPKKEKEVLGDRNTSNGKSTSTCLQSRQSCQEAPGSSGSPNSACKLTSRADTRKASSVNEARCEQRAYAHLTLNPSFTYEDFNCNDESRIPSLSIQEYNWQDHGYAMCSRLVGEVGAFLDERFKSALTIAHAPQKQLSKSNTSCTTSSAIVDQQNNPIPSSLMYDQTSPLPTKALWNYVQWLLGIHHDDCDYNALNKHLDPQLKAFIKTACCFPETLSDSNAMTTNGVQARVVEASVIVMEARLQSELLYALRAIMLHQC